MWQGIRNGATALFTPQDSGTEVSTPRRVRWWLIVVIGVVCVVAAVLAYRAFLPASSNRPQAAAPTSVVRRGDIVLRASGAGALQPGNQVQLGFGGDTKAVLISLNVKVSDHVKAGQLLAEVDNSAAKIDFDRVNQNLINLTSLPAIAKAEKSVATAGQNLHSAQLQVEYLISPDVYYWENEISRDQQIFTNAQAAASAAPLDTQLQSEVTRAAAVLDFAKDKLKEAQGNYHDYVLDNFTVERFNRSTNAVETTVEWPTAQDITRARQNVVIAQGALVDARNYFAALTGGEVPTDAAGANLLALKQAKLDVESAKATLDATQIYAPVDGTIMSVSAQAGDHVTSSPIIVMGDLSKLYIKTYVDEADFQMFQVGNDAQVVFSALPSQTFHGKVTQVDPTLSTSRGSSVVTGLVELDPTKSNLLMGMTASVTLTGAQAQNTLLIPLSALQQKAPGQYSVMVLRNGSFVPADVTVGLKDLVNAQITSGLQAGDVVRTGSSAAP